MSLLFIHLLLASLSLTLSLFSSSSSSSNPHPLFSPQARRLASPCLDADRLPRLKKCPVAPFPCVVVVFLFFLFGKMCGVGVLRPVCFAVIIHAHPTQVGGKQTPGAPQPLPSAGLFLKAQCGTICGTPVAPRGKQYADVRLQGRIIWRKFSSAAWTLIHQEELSFGHFSVAAAQ